MKYGSRAARSIAQATAIGRGFVNSMIDGIKDPTRATDEERARRLSVCDDCEYYDEPASKCELCKCRVQFKVRLETWRCPIGKW